MLVSLSLVFSQSPKGADARNKVWQQLKRVNFLRHTYIAKVMPRTCHFFRIRYSTFAWLILGGFLAGFIAQAAAARPAPGLLWNRSGLPAVFPLQVTSAMLQDYVVILRDAESGKNQLAAYLPVDESLRVLVPPGVFEIGFVPQDHAREGLEFAPAVFPLDAPLVFAVTGYDRKSGHIVDIAQAGSLEEAVVTVGPQHLRRGSAQDSARQRLPLPTEKQAVPDVGADILERRFLRGLDVYETYDPQRQQRDFDPPVRGLPRVPLVRPPRTGIPEIGPSSRLP